jgi:hypothetical protein
MRLRQRLVAALGIFVFVYVWLVSILFMGVALPHTSSSELSFTVSAVSECTRKCMGCRREAKLVAWPGTLKSTVCTDGLNSELAHGDRVVVKGRFSPLGVHVESVRGANAGSLKKLLPSD